MTIEAPVWLVGHARVKCIVRRKRGNATQTLQDEAIRMFPPYFECVFFLFGL